jgi:hypothetical protein
MTTMNEKDYFSGLDLGQTQDPTALAVLERTYLPDPKKTGSLLSHYAVRHLERFPLGTSYPEICARVAQRFEAAPLSGSYLGVDQTGVGRAVVDMLRGVALSAWLYPVTITSGHGAIQDEATGDWHVPKKDLVSALQILLQARRLKVSPDLPEAKTLIKELQNFRVKITLNANETYEAWREGMHDDLVFAVAIAAWLGEKNGGRGTIGMSGDKNKEWGLGVPIGGSGSAFTAEDEEENGILIFGDPPTPDRADMPWWEKL